MRNPSADLVVATWLRGVPGLETTNIANEIPRDDSGKITLSSWGERLVFVTGIALPGGDIDLGTDDGSVPALIECWARSKDNPSNKVPWERAAAAAELIRLAAKSDLAWGELAMPNPYNDVLMDGVEMESPARSPQDPNRLARYTFLMRFYYAVKD